MHTPDPASIESWLENLLPRALRLLRSMVEINSFTANATGVNRLGAFTAGSFASLGFEPAFYPSNNPLHGSHLVLRRAGRNPRPVLLVTHLDTVFPEEEEARNGFRWEESPAESRIYGPGTVDIKGGTILLWMLLHGLREFYPDLWESTSWVVAANASEEAIGAEFGTLLSGLLPGGARAVLVFEGGPRVGGAFHLVTARKGRAEYRLRAKGIAAHAGSAHAEGVNAIVCLSRVVQAAHDLTDYSRALTLNIGRIEGGTVVNRVPHEAVADLEIRAFDPQVLETACRSLEALGGTGGLAGPRATLEVQCLGKSPAWPLQPRNEALYALWSRTGEDLRMGVENTSRGGLSDANYLWQLGPTLDGLGPSGANAHCSEKSPDGLRTPEFVEIDSFVPKTLLNLLSLKNLLEIKENA